MERPSSSDCCSVCFGSFNIPCQANCSHWFCANCILQVWNYTSALQPCRCPLCRREITLLVPTALLPEHRNDSEVTETLAKIDRYNRQFGARSEGLFQRLQDLPFLLKRLFRDIMDPQRSLPFMIRTRVYLAMLVSALYVLSPIDLIPEGILGIIGLLDDALIALICFLHVAAIYRTFLVSRPGGS